MKLASRSTASKTTALLLLLICMVVSTAEAWLCQDCHPAMARNSTSQEALTSDYGDTGHGSEMTEMCPVCQSPPHVVSSYAPFILAFTSATSQDPPHLSGEISGLIYKPPRIAS